MAESVLNVMLLEDEEVFARAVAKRLQKAGFVCEIASSLTEGRALFKQFAPDLVLLDLRLPDGSGLDVLPEFIAQGAAVIVMTAHGEVSDAVSAMKQDAIDYLKKPIDLEELLLIVEKSQRQVVLKTQLALSKEREQRAEGVGLIGESAVMLSVRKQISQIARLSAVAQTSPPTVLISGETGTGKDVVARLLHQTSDRANRPFVQVDCASLPAELIESELFGHEKGAFTNAQTAHCGLIEAAEDGTLFLDEVGELPLNLQAKLLNVLERRMVRRLGSTKERPVAARFVAATNRDLQQMVLEGRFRADLFYRLHVLTLAMPRLNERGQDVALLAKYFLSQTERRYGLKSLRLDESALKALVSYPWPGNVRELKHVINRAALLCQSETISAADLALSSKMVAEITPVLGLTIPDTERLMIESTLSAVDGNVSKAARKLGLTRMAMRYRMEKHNIALS
ncbi:MAG: sigma-54 dependent transcriptional regulator [Methylophilales bacterium]|nr:sigma-54 dependent transcriptional regulator [Methylophilales bacterium]